VHDLFFSLSKAFWLVARPETWFGLLLAAAILALVCNRRRIGMGILVTELVLFISLAVFPLGDLFLAPLENRFPVRPASPAPVFVVVLGGAENAELSAATGMVNVNQAGERLLAAIELAAAYPEARLVPVRPRSWPTCSPPRGLIAIASWSSRTRATRLKTAAW